MPEEYQPDAMLDKFFEYWSDNGGKLTQEEANACATFAQWIASQGFVLIIKEEVK